METQIPSQEQTTVNSTVSPVPNTLQTTSDQNLPKTPKNKRLIKIILIIASVLLFLGIAGFLLRLFLFGTAKKVNVSFTDNYSISFALPSGYTLETDPSNTLYESVQVKNIASGDIIATFSFDPYSIPSYIAEEDGQINLDGIDFIISGNKEIACPLNSIFPENELKQPYTLAFSISTYCDSSTKGKYEAIQRTIITSLSFSSRLKEDILSENVENGTLNPSLITAKRNLGETKKLLEEYSSKIDIDQLSKSIEEDPTEYSADSLFSMAYEVIGSYLYPYVSKVGKNPYEEGSALYILNDPVLHKYLYEYLRAFYPDSILSSIRYLYFGTDGLYNTMGWVATTGNGSDMILHIDVLDLLDSLKNTDTEVFKTLVHESTHILNYRNDQINVGVTKSENCSTYFVDGWGCLLENSYLMQFYNKFWKDRYPEHQEDLENWVRRESFRTSHPGDFTNDYATTNVEEDFAESFVAYTYDDNPSLIIDSGNLIGKKYAYFENLKGLSYLRNQYRKSLGMSYDTSIDATTSSLENISVDTYLKDVSKIAYPKAMYIKSGKKNDCGDNIVEGSCEYITYSWGTDDSVEVVANWYKNSTPEGWIVDGDLVNNGYGNIYNENLGLSYILMVKQSKAVGIDSGYETVIFVEVSPN